jgi:hypothetical protein
MIRTRTIALLTTFVAAVGVTGALSVAAPHAQAPKRVALVGGMLLTGYEIPPIHHAAVVIEGSKIVAAGPASEVKIPADATIVDTSGRAMLPGLIETHGHLVVLGHGSYDTWFPWINSHGGDAMMTRVMEISARQLLMAGVTTTVDLGAPLKPMAPNPLRRRVLMILSPCRSPGSSRRRTQVAGVRSTGSGRIRLRA